MANMTTRTIASAAERIAAQHIFGGIQALARGGSALSYYRLYST
jgi:hypothetical protein